MTRVVLKINSIVIDPEHVLRTRTDEEVTALAQSIEQHGLMSPLMVRLERNTEGQYVPYLLGGYLRIQALHRLGRQEVEVIAYAPGEWSPKAIDLECMVGFVRHVTHPNEDAAAR